MDRELPIELIDKGKRLRRELKDIGRILRTFGEELENRPEMIRVNPKSKSLIIFTAESALYWHPAKADSVVPKLEEFHQLIDQWHVRMDTDDAED